MMKIILFVVLVACVTALPQQRQNYRLQKQVVQNVMRHAPRNAKLLSYSGPLTGKVIESRLVDNYTTIIDNVVGGFDCTEKVYGYYADTNNNCQIFHICVPLMQLFPDHYGPKDIMDFSFICPKFTIFTQDAMVCAYERSAVPCEYAAQLYHLNNNFFVVEDVPKETTTTPEVAAP